MIRMVRVLLCGNEHGTGDVCFPDIGYDVSALTEQLQYERATTAKELRKAAKEKGWGLVNGEDYCPGCMECMRDGQVEAA